MEFIPSQIIRRKRFGDEHSDEEINFMVQGFTSGELPDYQMSAWIMAVCFQGMSVREIATLTRSMLESGDRVDFTELPGEKAVDKHSTGGVGDKTSLILAPIAAAAGVNVPMIAGRGLGHTGGTLDKLESIPGFNINLNIEQFRSAVFEHGLAIMGQTKEICPADRKLYALRDVTGTVDSLPLICGSIMSKKLAEGLDSLVLDVKFGSGAFMKTEEQALQLAQLLKSTGEANGLRVAALITNMNRPLGRFAGNSCEVQECVDILQGKTHLVDGHDLYQDTRELSLQLAAHMIWLAELSSTRDQAMDLAEKVLSSGKAMDKFAELCERQGGGNLKNLAFGSSKQTVTAENSGYFSYVNTESLGLATVELGVGRKQSSDPVDHQAGIEFHVRDGQKLSAGDKLFTLFNSSGQGFPQAEAFVQKCFTLSDEKSDNGKLITRVLV